MIVFLSHCMFLSTLWSWVCLTNFSTPISSIIVHLMTKKRFIIMKIALWMLLLTKRKKRNMIGDWKLLSIYACKLHKKMLELTLAMLFKAHLSSIWWIFSFGKKCQTMIMAQMCTQLSIMRCDRKKLPYSLYHVLLLLLINKNRKSKIERYLSTQRKEVSFLYINC